MSSDASFGISKRSADQIEADLARTREELAATIDALADKVSPKLQAARAAEHAKAKAASVSDAAKGFAGNVAHGKPKAIAVVAAVLGLAAGAIVLAAKRRA